MMASAAISIPEIQRFCLSVSIFSIILLTGSGSPITPVEDVKTRASGTKISRATLVTILETASVPFFPVKALAFPELTIIAAPSFD